MNSENNDLYNDGMFARYLSGEMGDDERMAFEKTYSGMKAGEPLDEMIMKHWKTMDSIHKTDITNEKVAWQQLHARLNADGLIPARQSRLQPQWNGKFMRIAAAVLLLIASGMLFFQLAEKKPDRTEMLSVNTANESATTVKTLPDGSVIYIAGNSIFSFPETFSSQKRSVELKGEAFFDIAPDPAKPFVIGTSEAWIEVLGTAFNVKTENGEHFRLQVERGKVKVTLKDQPDSPRIVKAGEVVTESGKQLVVSKSGPGKHSLWYTQRMHFKDESLQTILNVLNRNYNVTFVPANKQIGQQRLTVTFENESVQTMTELICLSLNLNSQVSNDTILFLDHRTETGRN